MYRRTQTLLTLLLLCVPAVMADRIALTLDSCRVLAAESNKELRISETEMLKARYRQKSASTGYLPKISVTGLYMHTGKELSLLSDEQKSTLSGIGNALSMPQLNSIGEGLVEAMRTDTRNGVAAAAVLTQPVYMGGRINAFCEITRLAGEIVADRHDLRHQELMAEVDETYWSIVELTARKRLAESYLGLVKTLDGDIEKMIAEGFATKADGLSVKVKVNEANVSLIQVDNGIELLKMNLCRICGLPLDSELTLADEGRDITDMPLDWDPEESGAWENRPELSALRASVRISDEKVRIARAEFLPSVVLTGGYMASYPSVFNSFEKKFKGTWNIGLAVNIPVLTWGDRGYKVKEARADAAVARLTLEETREKIELQVSRNRQKVEEARERYAASLSGREAAEENLRYATVGLREGVIPVSNVIEAQTAWLSAQTNLISAGIDMRLADVYLRKALGTIR